MNPVRPRLTPQAAPGHPGGARPAARWIRGGLIVAGALFVLVLAGFALGRLGAATPIGRTVVSALVEGRRVGRFGTVRVEGLKGDPWGDFSVARLTVSDRKGVWLEARQMRVRWRPAALIGRALVVEDLSFARLRLLRRPELSPQISPPGPIPVDIRLDRVAGAVDFLPDFSGRYGRWIATGTVDLRRRGDRRARLLGVSLDRPGDFVTARLDAPRAGPLDLFVRAQEARGGPLAGALGYDPRRPFLADIFVRNGSGRGAGAGGRLSAIVRAGGFTPLFAQGQWSPKAARISGRARFDGSTLFAPLAARLGPEARFGLAATPQGGGRWAFGWIFLGETLKADARGVLRLADRTAPDGVTLRLSTPSLTRLAGRDVAGRAAFSGQFSGEAERWRITGDLDARDARLAGVDLARLRGPVSLRFDRGVLSSEVDLRGVDATGGWLARLMGPAPRARAQITRLADGRWTLDTLDARLLGGRVEGRGGRGLLGDLRFDGSIRLDRPELVRGGAQGRVDARIRAAWSSRRRLWSLDLDARGRRLLTGLGELDRLLGREPRLVARGDLGQGRVTLASAALSGRAGGVSGAGHIDLGGALALKLKWRAAGPFRAGPVEIAGNMSGDGLLTGTIAHPRADLTAQFGQIDAGPLRLEQARLDLRFASERQGFDGAAALAAQSAYGPARARADFRFARGGVALQGLDLNAGGLSVKGDAALSRGTPSSANLTFAVGPGAFLASGQAVGSVRLLDAASAAAADLSLSARDARLRGLDLTVRRLELAGHGTSARLPFSLDVELGGATPIAFGGTGLATRRLQSGRDRFDLALSGQGSVRGVPFASRAPITASLGPEGRAFAADLTVGGGRLDGRASLRGEALSADLTLAGVDLKALSTDLRGSLDGQAHLQGRKGALTGRAEARIAELRSRDMARQAAVDAQVTAALQGDRLQVEARARGRASPSQAEVTLNLPTISSASPLRLAVARDRPISGRFSVSGEVQPVWELLSPDQRTLSGQARTQGALSGTLADPQLEGDLTLRDGRFEDAGLGLVLKAVEIDSRFDRSSVVISRFTASDASKGQASGEGVIRLQRGAASSFRLDLKGFRLIDTDMAQARATGAVGLERGSDGVLAVRGALRVDEAAIAAKTPAPSGVTPMDVIEINLPEGRQAYRPKARATLPVRLDVTLKAPGRIRVRGRGLDLEFGLDARVTGTSAAPVLSGRAPLVRGDFDFAGRRFVFDDRGYVILSTRPADIRLALRAVREDPTLTAVVEVTGSAAQPKISLTSTPSLPQDEILSQMLFGRSASQLSGAQAAQLAAAAASLAGGGGFDVMGNLAEFAGLDRLTFGGDEGSGFTVAGGKRLADNVYLELIGGGREGGAVEVQWRVRRRLSIVSRLAGQGDAKLSLRWRRDFR